MLTQDLFFRSIKQTGVGTGLSIYPGILHNFNDGKTYSNLRLAVGAVFSDRMGLSFDWSDTEQIDFNFTPGTEIQNNRLWNVNLHFLF